MKKILITFLCVLSTILSFAQNVSNVKFSQEGQNARITYSLDAKANVSVSVSTDGGKTFSGALKQVTGDVGNNISPGRKSIVWDVLSEYDKLVGENICFRVSAGANQAGKRNFTIKGVTFNMVRVDGGTFTMGATPEQQSPNNDEKPTHRVTLSSYYIGETEVTQQLWETVMGINPAHFKGGTHPVEYISWNDCQEFIKKLNSLTGMDFRLPTEAEWEFAARGGNKSKGHQYSGSNNLNEVAWNRNNSGNETHPVATKVPNELGIYDMSGNVWEWCQDWYQSNYSTLAQTNPVGPASGSYRVSRGGSWYLNASRCRVASRYNYTPGNRYDYLGLRLALSE